MLHFTSKQIKSTDVFNGSSEIIIIPITDHGIMICVTIIMAKYYVQSCN